jgi:hypothetical protein
MMGATYLLIVMTKDDDSSDNDSGSNDSNEDKRR